MKKDDIIPPVTSNKPPILVDKSDKPTAIKTDVNKDVNKSASTEKIVINGVNEKNKATQLQVTLSKIYFSFDSYSLTKDARDLLSKNEQLLKQKSGVELRIEGHCDERGSDEYNLALGERRAKAAMNYLVTLGLPAESVSVISYGKEKPANPGHDEEAWHQNRRDEFIIVK